jgi:probable rRNA maturation factor
VTSGIAVQAAVGEGIQLPLDLAAAEDAVRHVLAAEGVDVAEISLAFLSDEEITKLNEGYLSHSGATDVISFALHESGEPPLGDVYIGAEQAARQATELEVAPAEELLRLVIHGTLHVLGHDHPEGADREQSDMYRRQEQLLASFLDRIGAAGR